MIEIALIVAILCAPCTSGITFERGSKGIVECPAMADNGYSADDTQAIYWYFQQEGSSDSPKSIITYLQGVIAPQSGYREQYNIQNISLVISNVTQSAEGTYSYSYYPWYKDAIEGSVRVSENVSCKAKRPKVNGCSEDQPLFKVEVESDSTDVELTCSVEHAKPAVNISWFQWSSSNKWEEIHATHQLSNASCNEHERDCFYVLGTINSNATIKATLESNSSIFKCVPYNSKLESITVNVIKTGSDLLNEVIDPTRLGSEEPSSSTNCTCTERPGQRYSPGFTILGFLFGVFVGIAVMLLFRYFKLKKKQTKKCVGANHVQCEAVALR